MSQQKDREIEELRQRVDELEALTEALQKRVASQSERIDELESGASTGRNTDHRDAAVLEQLQPGQKVDLRTLRQYYQNHTDMRSEKKIKNRIKALTQKPVFEAVDRFSWVYAGDGGEDSE